MTPYVMIGQSGLFGDYADVVEAVGGVLRKVVVNVADPVHPLRLGFAERLARANERRRKEGAREIEVEPLDAFRPAEGEHYVIGFRGTQVLPLRDRLVAAFDLRFEPLVHPSAVLSPTAELGEGVIVNAGAILASHVRVGRFALVNRGASLGHDGEVGECANVGPGAHVASNVRVGRGAAIGIGATVIEDRRIGEGAYVAAGAVVLADVPDRALVAGVPAVVKKTELAR
jgi:sugar O-acyltransferase (sialic acid O-acetyltransferase NeuD family)